MHIWKAFYNLLTTAFDRWQGIIKMYTLEGEVGKQDHFIGWLIFTPWGIVFSYGVRMGGRAGAGIKFIRAVSRKL